jgi:hypothetical protein
LGENTSLNCGPQRAQVRYEHGEIWWNDIVTYSVVLFTMELYCTPKVNTLQLNTASSSSTHVHVQPVRPRNTHSYRILPTGPLEAIFQHSLPFLQSESFQMQVGTIHRRAIGPLVLHNGTSAYTSLTRHLPAPTIGCLHRPP